VLVSVALWSSACATGTSAVAASTYGRTSVYRSATASVRLTPDRAFDSAVKTLLERGDIQITELKEADRRCRAVSGDRKLTFKVVDVGSGRSRMSMVVGGGRDPDANQDLADGLIGAVCGHFPVACEKGPPAP